MRNMRKWMTGLLAAAMLLSLAACSGGEQATPETESSGQGEMDEVDFSRTEGIWRLDGEEGTASIYMDGEGGFIAYYASGSVEAAGYLEYVDEYGDGNGRYDMYDGELGWINSFYFDSDTQIHMGNNDGSVYIRVDGEPAENPAPGALMYSPGFTGATPVETNNDFHGGYCYKDQLDDALTTIVNAGFLNDFGAVEGETIEQYIARWAEVICGWEIRDLAVQDGGTMGSYPASRVTWLTGENEDTRHWDALMVFTDLYTYFYGFNMSADYAGELDDLREDVFSQLELVFPEE